MDENANEAVANGSGGAEVDRRTNDELTAVEAKSSAQGVVDHTCA